MSASSPTRRARPDTVEEIDDRGRTERAPKVWLVDDCGTQRDSFEVGETIYARAHGLAPSTVLGIILTEPGAEARELARLTTDRYGNLPATAVLPHFGLLDHTPTHGGLLAPHEGERAWAGRRLAIGVGGTEARFGVPSSPSRPLVYPCDQDLRLVTGFEAGHADLAVALRRFPPGCVRLWAVPRQYDWRPGDPIEAALDRAGQPMVHTVRVRDDGDATVVLAGRRDLGPGSYQFIARSFVLGWFGADDDRLLAGDVVSTRRFASLVVRRPADHLGGFDNGVVLTPDMAGRHLAHRPYFQFLDNFPLGTDVYAALDPGSLPPNIVTTKAAIYVIAHKSVTGWKSSNALTDISGPGMTPAVKVVPIVPGCVNWNETLVWPNPQTPGKYDVVIDFGNNAADPQQFLPDATLDSPPDMIDGYVRTGFVVTADPSLPGPFAGSIGRHEYNSGTAQVPSTDVGPTPTTALPLTAVVRYPAQFSGDDAPFAGGAFPLVVVMHGNSGLETSYLGYNYLLDHLAGHGFVAVSIYAPVGATIEPRARAILQHLTVMAQNNADPGLFHGHVDLTRIGIAGHSRGGEAVVRAARINTAEALGWNIGAGVSIAPTDYHHYGDPGIPLVVVYGSNDGDVSGSWPDRTCFNIYDEAGRPRSFVFVYGATHDRFNSEWTAIEAQVELALDITPSDLPHLISETAHHNVANGYLTAFYRLHLLGQAEQGEYFSAGIKPFLVSSLAIHTSHQETAALVLDDFAQHNPAANTLGGAVTSASLPGPVAEDQLRSLDVHSPHVTTGGEVAWSSAQGNYHSAIPLANKDVSAFRFLSFRVTQKYGSVDNPPNTTQDFDVRMTDRQGRSRAIRVSTFTDIPYPYERGFTSLIKSAMKTVRIPLYAYTITNLGAQDVDLSDVASITLEFDSTSAGEVEVADLEFAP